MYTPITKRVKVAQHKSSVAKQMAKQNENSNEDSNEIQEEAVVQNEQGNKLKATATGNEGTFTPPEKYEGPDACEDPNSAACKEWTALNDRCQKDPNAEGCGGIRKFETGTKKPGDAKFSYDPELSEGQRGSSIDLFSSPEGRASFRTGQSQGRFTRKTAKQYAKAEDKLAKFLEKNKGAVPEAGDKGYRRYQKLLTARDTFKSQSEGAENRLKNYRQMTDGMRNRYITQRMEYDRKLQPQELGGQPVKAPEGTKTQSDFESDFNKRLGINGGSSNPQATTTPTSSFSEMAAALAKPIKLDTSALFTGNLFDKGQKKSAAFKMKGYGSKK